MRRLRRHERGYVLLVTMLLLVVLTFMGLIIIQLSGLEMQMAINEDINQECKACADGYQRYILAELLKGPQYLPANFPAEYPCSPRFNFVLGMHYDTDPYNPIPINVEGLGSFQTRYGWQRSGVLGRNWEATPTYTFGGGVRRVSDGKIVCEVLIRVTLP